jgi:pyruvate/2-oxoglutarate dehydrogenase complex dihydrolipoamide dehydrogenase (E3) component
MLDEIDSYPDDMTGSRVVVIGGAATGMDMMGFFGARGAQVTVADLAPAFGMQLDPCSKNDVAEKLDRYHVRKLYNTGLAEVRPRSFVVTMPDGSTEELSFDYGFVAMGMRSYNPLLADLEKRFAGTDTVVYNIGDSLRARQIIHGTEEGRNILRVLEAGGFLPA